MAEISRRSLIRASLALVCGPAIVRASSLMAVVPVPRRRTIMEIFDEIAARYPPPDVMSVGATQWAELQRLWLESNPVTYAQVRADEDLGNVLGPPFGDFSLLPAA